MSIDFLDIVQAELLAYDITLCVGCNLGRSHNRGYALADERTIHYGKKCATRRTLHGFLHEVGHVVQGHGKKSKLRRYEMEAEAEKYAADSLRQYGIAVPRVKVARGKRYVARMKRWGDNIRIGRGA